MSDLSVLRKYETNGARHYINIQTTEYDIFKTIRNYAESVIQSYEETNSFFEFDFKESEAEE